MAQSKKKIGTAIIANESSMERKKQKDTRSSPPRQRVLYHPSPPPHALKHLASASNLIEPHEPRSGPRVPERIKVGHETGCGNWERANVANCEHEDKGCHSVGELSRGFDGTRIAAIQKTRDDCAQWVYFENIKVYHLDIGTLLADSSNSKNHCRNIT
jgi:hypothetical protein